MKVRFLKSVDISGKLTVYEGETFDAVEDGDLVMIHVVRDGKDYGTVKAPKSEIDGILEVIE